jgi:hypothetical protein
MAMANNYDCCVFSVLKYLHRHKKKNGIADLRKAAHFVALRSQVGAVPGQCSSILMVQYTKANGFSPATSAALDALHLWEKDDQLDSDWAALLLMSLDKLAHEEYGEEL